MCLIVYVLVFVAYIFVLVFCIVHHKDVTGKKCVPNEALSDSQRKDDADFTTNCVKVQTAVFCQCWCDTFI